MNCQTTLALDAAFCSECGTSTTTASTPPLSASNTFTSLIAPVLTNMDRGNFLLKPMQWLFAALAVLMLLSPLGTIARLKEKEDFANVAVFAIVLSLFTLFMGWIGFQIWWNRKKHLAERVQAQDEFKAIPLFSYFLQTLGEWYGAYIAIMGVGTTIATFFISEESAVFISQKLEQRFIFIPDEIDYSSFSGIILPIVCGFLVLIVLRYAAELIRAIAAIANNTNPNK